jgi:hypothetical protein
MVTVCKTFELIVSVKLKITKPRNRDFGNKFATGAV